jgi:hypothetical protein
MTKDEGRSLDVDLRSLIFLYQQSFFLRPNSVSYDGGTGSVSKGIKSAHGVTVRVGVTEEDFESAFGVCHSVSR